MADAASLLESKVEEIDARIAELQKLRQALAEMVKTHRQGAEVPFAPAFQDFVRQLSGEALAGDNAKAGNRKRDQAKKIPKDA